MLSKAAQAASKLSFAPSATKTTASSLLARYFHFLSTTGTVLPGIWTFNPVWKKDDPILAQFRAALEEIYGDRLDRVVLFGSRARGDGRPDSDYDIAVFLKSLPDRWAELDRLADLRVSFIDETGAFFDVKPYLAAAYGERTPLMREIREEGLDL